MAKSAQAQKKTDDTAGASPPRIRDATTSKVRATSPNGNATATPRFRPKPDRRRQPRVSREVIAYRAYGLYLARGGEHGHDIDDWLQAERDLRDMVGVAAAGIV